jgi:hypothetical protein
MAMFSSAAARPWSGRLLASSACSLALLCAAQASGATSAGDQSEQISAAVAGPLAAATLEQCVTTVDQSERSATFSAEMTATPGTARMAMRIDIEERTPADVQFHTVTAPGLGVWRDSEPKVKVYKYLKQVTNLSSPAVYRALVGFRWLNSKGRQIRREERLTPKCEQPAAPPATTPPSAPGAEASAAGSS